MDGIEARIVVDPVLRQIEDIQRRQRRVVMYGIREASRQVQRVAKQRAPVYRGKPRTVKVNGEDRPLDRGELKRAIKPSRRLRNLGVDGFALKVGPRGDHVHLYAPKQERRTGFMRAGFEAVEGRADEIFARALERSIRAAARGR